MALAGFGYCEPNTSGSYQASYWKVFGTSGCADPGSNWRGILYLYVIVGNTGLVELPTCAGQCGSGLEGILLWLLIFGHCRLLIKVCAPCLHCLL